VVATDDDTAIANLPPLDAVADAVGGRTAEKLIAKVKPGGIYASVVEAPQNAAKYPSVKVVHVFSKFDRKTLESMAEAVRDGKLVIPIGRNCHSVKRPRLTHWRKRVASGRSCWCLELFAGQCNP
jgi:NADPH:quinone reductase-like Zn-dependent oxidoreductase